MLAICNARLGGVVQSVNNHRASVVSRISGQVAISLGTFFVAVLIVYFIVWFNVDRSFLDNHTCNSTNSYVYCFFSEDWDSETYLATITSFYETVINLLFILITLISGFAFVFVRFNTIEHARQEVREFVPDFISSPEVAPIVDQSLSRSIGMSEGDLRKLKRSLEMAVEQFKEKAEDVETMLLYFENEGVNIKQTIGASDEETIDASGN